MACYCCILYDVDLSNLSNLIDTSSQQGKKKSKSKKGQDSKLSKKAKAAKKATAETKSAPSQVTGKVEISSRTPSSKASVKASSLNVNETTSADGQPGLKHPPELLAPSHINFKTPANDPMKASKVKHLVTGSNGKRKSSEMKNGNIKTLFQLSTKTGGKKGKESGGGDEDSKPASKKRKAEKGPLDDFFDKPSSWNP